MADVATSKTDEVSTNSTTNNTRVFDLTALRKHFQECRDNESLLLANYLLGYDELLRFLQTLSSAFYFVVKDVADKICILRGLLGGSNGEHYSTVEGMLRWEQSIKFSKVNGSRTLLRLHRAMLFIILIFTKLMEEPPEVTISSLAGEAYKASLDKHHSWPVRKAVGVALYLLPSREALTADISDMNKCTIDDCRDMVLLAVVVLQSVYDRTQDLYSNYDALNLS